MKFIHTADLHLDAKLESNLPTAKAKIRRRELLETFRSMVQYGEEHGVSVFLIAGDLFDAEHVSEKTRDFVTAVIRDHPGMTFLYLRGNHDGGFGGDTLPENVKTFVSDSGWVSYRFGNTVFSGTEHNDAPGIYEELRLHEADVNIVVMHGQESASSAVPSEDTVCLKLLKNKQIDLLALGHLHTAKTARLDRRGTYRYAGCPDGRGFDECGEKGFFVTEVTEDGTCTDTFVPSSSRVLHTVQVDVGGLVTYPETEEKVLGAVEGIRETDLIKVELIGAREPDARFDTDHLTDVLNRRFWFAKLKNLTMLAVNPDDYAGDVSLKGEFIRLVSASRMSREQKDLVITTGLRVLRGEEPDV